MDTSFPSSDLTPVLHFSQHCLDWGLLRKFSNLKSVRQSPPVWHNLDNWGKMAPNHQYNELQLIKRGSWQSCCNV